MTGDPASHAVGAAEAPGAVPASPAPRRAALAGFQQRAVEGLAGSIRTAERLEPKDPALRDRWARSAGVMLLEAPTGSGKTLMLGRALEAVRGALRSRCAWFWFAPYSGLVAQTRDTLAAQCPSLRLRDVATDRAVQAVRDGDVFVQTWAAVAASKRESRKVRREAEDGPSLDQMLAGLRDAGVRVGVVIDEAHLNFGASARAAASFYLDVLRPDFTLLATATPNDSKLEEFERAAGVSVESRIVVDREEAVRAGLNKRGLMMGVLRLSPEDARLVDPEQATLTAAWSQHKAVQERLEARGLSVAPLMLVQVEDQAAGEEDPVQRVRGKLREIGVPDAAIAVHTSGEPDPDFHSLAYDPSKAVLVFKVAVATGFDAPRAWTLVSVRPNRGVAFGMQIVGRIMRVHPAVRPIHGQDDRLDRGYVFLTDPELQQGLDAAVQELKAVRSSIQVIAGDLGAYEFSNTAGAIAGVPRASLPRVPSPPVDDAERQARLSALVEAGFAPASATAQPAAAQDRAIAAGEWRRSVEQAPLFGALPLASAPAKAGPAIQAARRYRLRTDRGVPPALLREVLPEPHEMDGATVQDVAKALFRQPVTPYDLLTVVRRQATLSLRDLFLAEEVQQQVQVRMSAARIAEAAQEAFEFNDRFDPRRLKAALVAEFQRVCDARGSEADERSLRRALDLFAMTHPDALRAAIREAQAAHLRVVHADPLPALELPDGEPAVPSRLGAYEVFPSGMNGEERAFAEFLDKDLSGRVLWWLRLQENARWAVTLVLPNGRRFFPDFAVGVSHRQSRDHVALVEIKDDGESGRLHSLANRQKIRAQHREYRNVTWTYRLPSGKWVEAVYERHLDDIVPRTAFEVEALVRLG